ncbi:queuosine precursor transporter [Tenacibaculum sp. IB213877]|uniref:queuosine precursor transporter n=1 Tax=Tenacibaculum sp. IB213877 TaxID=3097351 RepID=UPI002A59E4D5|nr:queuosine precursor transporter [Tenacibaculum sp. IB213877]MDY0780756.1 queuosine precursor transporter [Tenacibaculum sp. IB213877]
MTEKNKLLALNVYLILAALFIASLVASNLIFQKFFYWNPFGLFRFEISVGILPYPITFLITDVLSEIYGKKKANQVVIAGIFASFFSMLIILVADFVPAIDNSPVNNQTFSKVFGLSPLAVLASMLAYLFAQFVDIKIFHFWKDLTKGKHLWLRNNFSTFTSQFIDTFTVLFLLCSFKIIPWNLFLSLLASGFLFKIIIAALDTPILYGLVYIFRRKFNLKIGEEIKLL